MDRYHNKQGWRNRSGGNSFHHDAHKYFKGDFESAGDNEVAGNETPVIAGQAKFKAGTPNKEHVSDSSDAINYVAFRDLQFGGAIEPKADPNTEIQYGSYPYAILNRTNRVVDANYPGYDNIAGNSIVRLQNSGNSQFMNFYDTVAMIKRINYLYLPIDASARNAKNLALSAEMAKTMEQAISYGASTMLTQLPFYYDYTVTDMPRPAQYATTINENSVFDRMGALIHYQCVLQNLAAPLAKYTETMSEQQYLLNMSYRRESPLLIDLFGLFKKKAYVAQLNALGSTMLVEYFDVNWWNQVNTFRHIPSRRSDDMQNPLVSVITSTAVPRLQVWGTTSKTGDAYYDSDNIVVPSMQRLNMDDWTFYTATKVTLEQLVLDYCKMLDPFFILDWARSMISGSIPEGGVRSASTYYEYTNTLLKNINLLAGRFSSYMTEIRTFLDKLYSTGMIYWKKGIAFNIDNVQPTKIDYNQIVADVLAASIAGASAVKYDTVTMRWKCNTMWNMYTGISQFDKRSGGAFFTFALREIEDLDVPEGETITSLRSTSSAYLLPIMFDTHPIPASSDKIPVDNVTGAYALNRLGGRALISSEHMTASDLLTDTVFSRLDPLEDATMDIKVPTVSVGSAKETYPVQARLMSSMGKMLTTIVGYGKVSSDHYTAVKYADPDYMCFIDLQIEDVSNAMIQYARNYSPFRVSTPNPSRTMGFGK